MAPIILCPRSAVRWPGSALGVRRSALGVRRLALGARRSALGARRSGLGVRRSALGVRRSGLGVRRSGLGVRRSGLGVRRSGPLARGPWLGAWAFASLRTVVLWVADAWYHPRPPKIRAKARPGSIRCPLSAVRWPGRRSALGVRGPWLGAWAFASLRTVVSLGCRCLVSPAPCEDPREGAPGLIRCPLSAGRWPLAAGRGRRSAFGAPGSGLGLLLLCVPLFLWIADASYHPRPAKIRAKARPDQSAVRCPLAVVRGPLSCSVLFLGLGRSISCALRRNEQMRGRDRSAQIRVSLSFVQIRVP
jgi:hypothetical protein